MTTDNPTTTLLHDATVEVVNRAQELLGLTHGATNDDGTCSDPSCPCHEFARKEVEQPRPQLWADATTVRAAIFDVLDGGCNCQSGEKHPWELDEVQVDEENPALVDEVVPTGWCDSMPCTQADQACQAQQNFEYESCMQLENDFWKCYRRSGQIYHECMAAHGCPIIN